MLGYIVHSTQIVLTMDTELVHMPLPLSYRSLNAEVISDGGREGGGTLLGIDSLA